MKKKAFSGLLSVGLLLGISNGAAFANHSISGEKNDKDCDDFATTQEVMEHWYNHGYSANNDPEGLDRDNDGLACEVTKGEWDSFVASKQQQSNTDEDNNSSEQQAATDTDDEEMAEQEQPTPNSSDSQTTNTDSSNTEEEGGELPETASNQPLMILSGMALILTGAIFALRRKPVNEK